MIMNATFFSDKTTWILKLFLACVYIACFVNNCKVCSQRFSNKHILLIFFWLLARQEKKGWFSCCFVFKTITFHMK